MTIDEKYMWRCIELAKNGEAYAAPNPMVGAVIVCDGNIIGEGYHIICGGPHAEVNAIKSVKDESLLERSTIYVSLEPCSHYGKTPPCADLIVLKKIPRVVIGCMDPFAKVDGRGVERLRSAGCDVTVGVLEDECRNLIRKFITFNTLKRPYIILKWAQSIDGSIDYKRESGQPVLLSNSLTSMRVHKLRSLSKAILVGERTAQLDNPSLGVRHWYGNSPIRVVIDEHLNLSEELALFDGSIETLIVTAESKENRHNVTYVTIDFSQAVISQIMDVLYQYNIQSLLIEGGAYTLQKFIEADCWDEAFVEISDKEIGDGVKAPIVLKFHRSEFSQHFGHNFLHYLNGSAK